MLSLGLGLKTEFFGLGLESWDLWSWSCVIRSWSWS